MSGTFVTDMWTAIGSRRSSSSRAPAPRLPEAESQCFGSGPSGRAAERSKPLRRPSHEVVEPNGFIGVFRTQTWTGGSIHLGDLVALGPEHIEQSNNPQSSGVRRSGGRVLLAQRQPAGTHWRASLASGIAVKGMPSARRCMRPSRPD
jgi:hypothetical protein